MKKKAGITTLEKLAGMVQRGFDSIEERDKDFRTEVNERFDRLEKIIFHDHNDRISRLEDEMKETRAEIRSMLSGKH